MIEKTFLNPATNKQWRIEIDGHTIRTCLNGGKVKEILCDSVFQVKSKTASAMMSQMRKGFVYQNPDAAVGQARCHRFVGKDSNGFMPLAAALTRDDFFLTRVVGDFEDETLYHFDDSGEILETVSLGAKRMTYEQILCPNDTLLMNNSYLIEQFSLHTHEITPFANKKNSMRTMLDVSGDLAMWYTGEEIVVFDFGSNTEVWRETVKCKKSKDPNFVYYCFGMLSPRQTKVVYRVAESEYVIVDLKSAELQDATTGTAKIDMSKLLGLTDWRGKAFAVTPVDFYNYYGVEGANAIAIDKDKIMTTLNASEAAPKLLKDVAPNMSINYTCNLQKTADDITYGDLVYENGKFTINAPFKLFIPVTVKYTFGEVTSTVTLTITPTHD